MLGNNLSKHSLFLWIELRT